MSSLAILIFSFSLFELGWVVEGPGVFSTVETGLAMTACIAVAYLNSYVKQRRETDTEPDPCMAVYNTLLAFISLLIQGVSVWILINPALQSMWIEKSAQSAFKPHMFFILLVVAITILNISALILNRNSQTKSNK